MAGPWPFWLPAGAGPAPRLSWLPFSLVPPLWFVRWRRLVANPGDRYFYVIAAIMVFVLFPGVLHAVRFLSMDFR